MKTPFLVIAVCGALAFAGCGGSSDSSTGSTAAGESTRIETTAAGSKPARESKPPKGLKGPEPTVQVPKGSPPKKLVIKDLKKGSGKEAKTGDEITIQFAGIEFSGNPIDSSWELGGPFEFKLGTTVASPGWEKGIPGMRVGGRRELIMPWTLTTNYPPENSKKEAWVYVIDLLKVRS